MRYGRLRTALALTIGVPLYIILSTGCASVPTHDPLYNGDPLYTSSDSTTFVRLKIENLRTQDAIPPHIYLVGSGTHPLGVLMGMGGKIDRLVDTSWFRPDGCFQIVAHFPGSGNFSFSVICWKPGEMAEATLLDHWDPNTAWAHR